VVRIKRRALIDGSIVSQQTHWLPAELVPELGAELRRTDSLYTVLVDVYDLAPRRWWSRAELATAPPDVARLLDYERSTQVWFMESCNRCVRTGRVVELAHSWLRPDAFRVRFEHGPSDGAR
jgi:DNA-binding GntR family transcriptional regulator